MSEGLVRRLRVMADIREDPVRSALEREAADEIAALTKDLELYIDLAIEHSIEHDKLLDRIHTLETERRGRRAELELWPV
jgi:hypothetical protein